MPQGQFPIVVADEMPKIKEAFRKLSTPGKPYLPKLTIVVCGKRHHARMLGTAAEQISKNGNTLPGTVVDNGITDIYNHDFYLQVSPHSPVQLT